MFASTGESRTKATMCVIPPGTKTPNKSIPEADHRLWPRSGIWQLDSSDCTASRKSKKLPNGWPATVIAPYHCSLPRVTATTYSEHDFALGLTLAPQAFSLSACPAARILTAALSSRSCTVPQPGHTQIRTRNGISPITYPHAEHVLDEGSHRDTLCTMRPYFWAFSSISRTNCAQPAS